MTSEVVRKLPLVVVLGATATGKSKLAISLATKFKGEVISADSMQIYKSLDILTNKVTVEEMQGVPHHMMSMVEPKQNYNITEFQKQALPIVERILQEEKLPIIVGGTNYYIESLLWHVLVSKDRQSRSASRCSNEDGTWSAEKASESGCFESPRLTASEVLNLFKQKGGNVEDVDLVGCSTMLLHSALEICDPARASNLHPNNRRKILRSLQVYYQTGKAHSALISEQRRLTIIEENKASDDGATQHLGGPLRFPDTICFWVQANKELLDQRIDQRVDEMVVKGLRNELESYMEVLQHNNSDLDFTRGILQSIGFKEFNSYLRLSVAEKQAPVGNARFSEGVDLLKIATRQYAKRQLRWIKQRFLQPKRRQVPPIYSLDGNLTDAESWDVNVTQPAEVMLENYLKGNFEHHIFLERRVATTPDKEDDETVRYCEICENRALLGKLQWEGHLAGRRHRLMKKRTESKSATHTDPKKPKLNCQSNDLPKVTHEHDQSIITSDIATLYSATTMQNVNGN